MGIRRYDFQKLDGYEVTPQGFLRIPVYAARTGIQIYRDSKGREIRELRPPEEVFSEQTMGSLRSCPLTNDHPSDMVTLDNAKELVCGMTADIAERVEDQFLKTYVTVYDKKTVQDIKDGKVEVSMGYNVEMDWTPGEFNGQKYDAIQRKIVHNHIALVHRARGGRQVRLRLDAKDAILVDENQHTDTENGGHMPKIKLAGKEYDVAQELVDAFGEHMKDFEEKKKVDAAEAAKVKAETDKAAAEAKVTTLTTERDTLQAKVDSLEADKAKGEPKLDTAALEAAVKERRRIERVAAKVLDEEALKKTDEMSALELKKAVILADCKDAKLDAASEAYVNARFDHIADQAEASEKANGEAGKLINANRKKAGEDEKTDSEKARQESQKRDAEAWKKPVGKSA